MESLRNQIFSRLGDSPRKLRLFRLDGSLVILPFPPPPHLSPSLSRLILECICLEKSFHEYLYVYTCFVHVARESLKKLGSGMEILRCTQGLAWFHARKNNLFRISVSTKWILNVFTSDNQKKRRREERMRNGAEEIAKRVVQLLCDLNKMADEAELWCFV